MLYGAVEHWLSGALVNVGDMIWCLWIVRYNSQDATVVLCYTQQFVQRHQAEMLSHGAMRVYENSSSSKRQQHVDPWKTCCRALRQDSSQLKMEWLVDQKLILYQPSWYAAGDWRRWHQIWQGLDTVNCGVAKCELHWDILPGMQVGNCRFCLLLCKPEYRPRIAYNSIQTNGLRLTVVKCKVQKEEVPVKTLWNSDINSENFRIWIGRGGTWKAVVMR